MRSTAMTRELQNASLAALLALPALLAGVAARADEPDPAHAVAGELEVRLAEVEVVVTDRKGNPIPGLGRDDFVLLAGGEPVEITHFSAFAAGERISGPEHGDERLNLVIYVDRSYLAPGDLRGLREELKTFLRTALRDGDRVMLVSSHRSLELRQELTTLPELVIDKLEEIRERPGGARLVKEYQDVVRDIRRVRGETLTLPGQDPNALIQGLLSRVEAFSAEVVGEIGHTAGRLEHLARAISGLPGRKAVLYVGGRLPVSLVRALFDTWQDAFRPADQLVTGAGTDPAGGAASGPAGAGGATIPQVRPGFAVQAANVVDAEAEQVVARLAEIANACDLTFYGLDAGGLRRSTTFLSTADSPSIGATTRIQSQAQQLFTTGLDALASLAVETGGMIFSGNQDFGAALAKVGRDFDSFYTLGFVPRPGGSRIEVKLRDRKQRRLRLRYRRQLEVKDRDLEAAERTVSALLLDASENPLAVEVSAGEAAPDGDGYRVPVSITVPLSRLALIAEGRAHQGRLTIFVTTGSLGRLRPVEKVLVPLRIANRDLLTSLGRRVEYRLDLKLPAGLERIAVTVRDEYRPLVSTTFATLEVGAAAPAPAASPAS